MTDSESGKIQDAWDIAITGLPKLAPSIKSTEEAHANAIEQSNTLALENTRLETRLEDELLSALKMAEESLSSPGLSREAQHKDTFEGALFLNLLAKPWWRKSLFVVVESKTRLA